MRLQTDPANPWKTFVTFEDANEYQCAYPHHVIKTIRPMLEAMRVAPALEFPLTRSIGHNALRAQESEMLLARGRLPEGSEAETLMRDLQHQLLDHLLQREDADWALYDR